MLDDIAVLHESSAPELKAYLRLRHDVHCRLSKTLFNTRLQHLTPIEYSICIFKKSSRKKDQSTCQLERRPKDKDITGQWQLYLLGVGNPTDKAKGPWQAEFEVVTKFEVANPTLGADVLFLFRDINIGSCKKV